MGTYQINIRGYLSRRKDKFGQTEVKDEKFWFSRLLHHSPFFIFTLYRLLVYYKHRIVYYTYKENRKEIIHLN